MKRIFLHIGHVKTGTSAIQHFFLHNKERLKERGVLYPETGLYGPGQHKIPVNMMEKKEIYDFLTYFEKSNYSESFYEKNLRHRLISEIANSECSKVLISSEYFIFMNDLSILKSFLNPFDVRIILSLRRQDLLLESFYRQVLLVGYSKGIKKFLETYRHLLLDYRKIIEKWSEAFGSTSLILLDYGTFREHTDIYRSFINIIDIAPNDDLNIPDEPVKRNETMDVGFAALLRIFNRIGISAVFEGRMADHLRVLQDSFGSGYLGQGTFLSPENCQKLLKEFSQDNKWIETMYLDGPSSITSSSNITRTKYSGVNFIRALKMLWLAYKRDTDSHFINRD